MPPEKARSSFPITAAMEYRPSEGSETWSKMKTEIEMGCFALTGKMAAVLN